MANASTDQETAAETFGAVALYIDQVLHLSQALKTVLGADDAEAHAKQIAALATAVERAAEDAASAFDANYHPANGTL